MIIKELKKYSKILILGYGIEGQETERFLKGHFPESEIIIADQNDGPDYLEKQDGVDLVIKTPGISSRFVTKPYTTATNIFFANTNAMMIGITGTKGKSTTAALTHHILESAGKSVYLAGNIGIPMLSLVDKVGHDDMVVLELSSYQLEDIKYSPHIAVILNLYQELHNHDSFEEYKAAKFNIVRASLSEDYFIYNPAFPELSKIETNAKKVPFEYLGGDEDVNAAFTIGKLFGVVEADFTQSIKSFKPLPHRMQPVGEFFGITFINDSASTHPQSTIEALSKIKNINTLIVGGQNRGYEFDKLVSAIVSAGVKNVILFPDTGKVLEPFLLKQDMKIFKTDNMELAVSWSFAQSQPGSVCLISPGAPSYLTFKNFQDRGEQFMYYIKRYGTQTKETREENFQKE